MASLELQIKKVHFDNKRISLNFIKDLYTLCADYFKSQKKSLSYLVYAELIATHLLNNTCVPKSLKITSSTTPEQILHKIANTNFNCSFVDLGTMLFDKSTKGVSPYEDYDPVILDQSSKRERIKNTLSFLQDCGLVTFQHEKGSSNFSVMFSFEFLCLYRNSLNKFFIIPDHLYYILVSADCSSNLLALIYLINISKDRYNKDLIEFFKKRPSQCSNTSVFSFISNTFKEIYLPTVKELKEFFAFFGISKSNIVGFSKRAISYLVKLFNKNTKLFDTSIEFLRLTKKYSLYIDQRFDFFKNAIIANFQNNMLAYIKKAITPN